jgi:archaellum component FlaC
MAMYYNNISSVLKQVAADFDSASDAIVTSQNRVHELEKKVSNLEVLANANAWDISDIRNYIETKERVNKEKIIDIINILMRDN